MHQAHGPGPAYDFARATLPRDSIRAGELLADLREWEAAGRRCTAAHRRSAAPELDRGTLCRDAERRVITLTELWARGQERAAMHLLLDLPPVDLGATTRAYRAITGEKLFDIVRSRAGAEACDRLARSFGLTTLAPRRHRPAGSSALESVRRVCGPEYDGLIERLLRKRAPQRGGEKSRPALLSRDAFGGRLLDSLFDLASAPLHPRLERERSTILRETVARVSYPGLGAQGIARTCKSESVAFITAVNWPAEYARIQAGLASPSGLVELAGGAVLVRDRDVLEIGRRKTLGLTDWITHASLMEFANGDNYEYCAESDRHFFPDPVSGGRRDLDHSVGLSQEEGRILLEAVFDRPFVVLRRERFAPELLLDIVSRYSRHRHLLGSLRWDDESDAVHRYHAVSFFAVKQDRVHFRNPWGPRLLDPGTVLQGPTRRSETPANGHESMHVADFLERVHTVVPEVRGAIAALSGRS